MTSKSKKSQTIYHLKVDLLQYSPITECYVAIKKKKQDKINPVKAGQWKGSYQVKIGYELTTAGAK